MAHNNFESLKQAILKKAQKGMEKKVLPIVQTKMISAIKKTVYAVYSPIWYGRRRGDDGLIDMKNIIGDVVDENSSGGFDYKIENTTKPESYRTQDYLAPLIIMGQLKAKSVNYPVLYDEYHNGYVRPEHYEYGQPRDFIGATKENLDKRLMASSLEDYMKL